VNHPSTLLLVFIHAWLFNPKVPTGNESALLVLAAYTLKYLSGPYLETGIYRQNVHSGKF
jgi:hypothetical protein